jgi:ESCRT-II complex subunit VPS22
MSARYSGRSGLLRKMEEQKAMQAAGAALNKELREQMQVQLEAFSKELESFAFKYRKDIQQDPVFRAKFHEMCNKLGVDPLTSQKGLWSKMLGLGDFYYELGVRIIEICVRTRQLNGGFIALDELLRAVRKRRTVEQNEISEEDIERAVKKLEILGSGFKIVAIGSERLIRSVPVELSVDHTSALALCRETKVLSPPIMKHKLGWDERRIENTLQYLLDKELAWLDLQSPSGPEYWVLGLVPGSSKE